MSRRACILGEPTGWHAARLATLLERRGFRPAIIRWRELAARITAEGDWFRPPEFAEADVVVVRGMPGTSPPEARLEEVIFRMDVLARLAADGTPVINPPRSLEIAIDKYLSLSLLAAAGLAVPQTIVVQDAAAAIEAWERLGGDCVIKPLFGSRGRGVPRGRRHPARQRRRGSCSRGQRGARLAGHGNGPGTGCRRRDRRPCGEPGPNVKLGKECHLRIVLPGLPNRTIGICETW